MTPTPEQLEAILDRHAKWLREEGGERANLSRANLSRANLYRANLYRADLREADLRWADLRGAVLSGAVLSGANLYRADLRWAALSEANLRGADLSGANLYRADLSAAVLSGAKIRDNLTLDAAIGHASRGDEYTFYAYECSAGEMFIIAGCRKFLRSEYEAHIEAKYPNTDKAKWTRACLDYLESLREKENAA